MTNPPFGSDIPITDPAVLGQFELSRKWEKKDGAMVFAQLKGKQVSGAFLQASGGQAPRAGSLRELVHQGRGQCFGFAVEAHTPREPALGVRYELCLELIEHHALRVRNEYLFTFGAADRPSHADADAGSCLLGETHPNPAWHFMPRREPGGDSVFRFETPAAGETRAQVPPERLALGRVQFEGRDAFPTSRWLFDLLTEQALFFAPDWTAPRAACPPGQPDRLLADGRNLPWLARRLRADDPERFASWREHVTVALPQVTDIEALEREEDHHAYLRLSDQHGYKVTSSGLSEGTLRILALTLIPYLPQRPRLLIVEESENGIHPRAIEAVLQSLASVYDTQVLLSSHSPVVVAQTPLAQLLVARLEAC